MIPSRARRTIEETRLLYRLEPSLRDIYVEGPSDRALVLWFLDAVVGGSFRRRCAVYTADDIHIDAERTSGIPHCSGSKARLLAAAEELALSCNHESYLIVVDSDFDLLFDTRSQAPRVRHTDHPDMDGYLLCDTVVKKVLHMHTQEEPERIIAALASLGNVLAELFGFRAAIHSLREQGRWPSDAPGLPRLSKYLVESSDGGFSLGIKFLPSVMSQGRHSISQEEFVDEAESLVKRMKQHGCRWMHSDDFTQVLTWLLRKRATKGAAQGSALHLARTGLESRSLGHESLFHNILLFQRG